ncbi:hypothetical protein BDR03DRAFT_1002648 [Suillus americanus]|nr:hypothetical protein BDR03DRAFT_1002648 [Suillus americanus]
MTTLSAKPLCVSDTGFNDIAAARNLQFIAHICTSAATFWTYDFVCSPHEECTFLLRSRWTKVKGFYIIARYVLFVLIIVDLCLTLAPNENLKKCQILGNIYIFVAVISLTFSECISPYPRHRCPPDEIHTGFFILRTYALWNNNRIVLVAMLSALFATVVSSIGILLVAGATSVVMTSTIPGIPGCFRSPPVVRFFLPFIIVFVFVFQLGLVCLTIIRVIQSWRSANSALYPMLVKHNIFYYACSLLSVLISDDYCFKSILGYERSSANTSVYGL